MLVWTVRCWRAVKNLSLVGQVLLTSIIKKMGCYIQVYSFIDKYWSNKHEKNRLWLEFDVNGFEWISGATLVTAIVSKFLRVKLKNWRSAIYSTLPYYFSIISITLLANLSRIAWPFQCDERVYLGDHSFYTFSRFSEKPTFLTPWYTHVRVHIRG